MEKIKTPTLTVYHNTRCSKSRGVCDILAEKKVKTNIVEYLKTPPTQKELKELLKMLGMKASELVRKNEPLFKGEFEGKKITEAQWLKILSQHPILIERPIIVKGDKAIIGRPPEIVLEFLKGK
ncbi:MAG: arsenate reductase [Bacteroidetes bacterium]|jgi:arsenate reductase|nr:arsenate reductase [Bacteroidota bacterium]